MAEREDEKRNSDKIKLDVDGTVHEVDGKPITAIFHDGQFNIQPVDPDVAVIDPIKTIAAAEVLDKQSWDNTRAIPEFIELWRLVWGEVNPPEDIHKANQAMKHTVGLIFLIVEAMAQGMRPYLKTPEAFLHPKQQLGLADLIIKLSGD